jgi:hypothetical protein
VQDPGRLELDDLSSLAAEVARQEAPTPRSTGGVMQRHREIAGAPVRSATETWAAIGDLIADTLTRRPAIERSAVRTVLDAARPAGLLLVARGNLE